MPKTVKSPCVSHFTKGGSKNKNKDEQMTKPKQATLLLKLGRK